MRSHSLSATVLACALAGATAAAHADVVDVYVFDFEVSIYPPDQGPFVDPVIFAGDTIRWVWLHDFHNVIAVVGQTDFWESDVFEAGATYVYTFNTPGIYQYFCAPHGHDNFDGTYEGMGGSVTVLAVPGPGTGFVVSLALLAAVRRRRSQVRELP